jgi:hypothetical protein
MFYKKVPIIFLNCAQVLGGVPLLLLPLCLSLAPSLFSPSVAQCILISILCYLSCPSSIHGHREQQALELGWATGGAQAGDPEREPERLEVRPRRARGQAHARVSGGGPGERAQMQAEGAEAGGASCGRRQAAGPGACARACGPTRAAAGGGERPALGACGARPQARRAAGGRRQRPQLGHERSASECSAGRGA